MICEVLLGIVVILLFGKLFSIAAKRFKYVRMVNAIPGPPYLPILGNAWDLWVPFEDVFMAGVDLLKRYEDEPVVRFWIGPQAKIVIKHESAAQIILNNSQHVNKSMEYDIMIEWLGTGLANSTKVKWEKRRRMINPAFSVPILEGYIPVFNEQSQILIETLSDKVGKGSFDIAPCVGLCAFNTIFETAMGSTNDQEDNLQKSEYMKAAGRFGDIIFHRITHPLLQSPFLFSLTRWKRIQTECIETWRAFTRNLVNRRRMFLEKEKDEAEKDQEKITEGKRHFEFLDFLLRSKCDGQQLTDNDVREELDIHIAAGNQTTSSAMSFTLHLLGHHMEIQKRVLEEVVQVTGKTNGPISANCLNQLKYLEAVIKEALRLFPNVPVLGRKLMEEVVINGHTIPTDTTVFIGVWLIHRDPKIYPDPEKFDPERFLVENAVGRPLYAYLPFLAGPRNCIGHKYAMMEMKVVLANIVKNFKISSTHKTGDLKFTVGPDLRPFGGIHVSLEKWA